MTQRDFVENALAHGLSSRNTAAAFFAEALYYGLIRVCGPDRGRASIAEPAPRRCGACVSGIAASGCDRRPRRRQPRRHHAIGGITLLAAVEPVVADALLASPLIRNPPSTYAVFASVDEGGSLMDRLIAGSDPTADLEERAVTDVTSVSALAKPFNISRTHAGRTLAGAIALGAIGWTGCPGRSPLWLSRAFREDYARVQATKLVIIAAPSMRPPPERASAPAFAPCRRPPPNSRACAGLVAANGQRSAAEASLAIGARLDALPACKVRLTLFAVLTLGLFADMAGVALGNALAAVFQSPTDPPDIAVFRPRSSRAAPSLRRSRAVGRPRGEHFPRK